MLIFRTMRQLALIILGLTLIFSCVKKPTKDPVPVLKYKAVNPLGKATSASQGPRDTAVLIFSYEDGDGDLFRDSNSDGPNLVYSTYAFNADSNKFILNGYPSQATITQPDNGNYKGKSIHGEIYVPMLQFRSGDNIKVIKFEAFMVDMKDHKSNVISSPVFTLNF